MVHLILVVFYPAFIIVCRGRAGLIQAIIWPLICSLFYLLFVILFSLFWIFSWYVLFYAKVSYYLMVCSQLPLSHHHQHSGKLNFSLSLHWIGIPELIYIIPSRPHLGFLD